MRPDADFLAQVGPITFRGGDFDWHDDWYVTDVSGLNDGVSVTPDQVARGRVEGQFDLPNNLSDARTITLKGFAYASTIADLGNMARTQGALLALSEQWGAFTWQEFGEWLTVDVRRGPGWEFQRSGSTGFAEFQVRLRAPSQVFYGVEPASASGTDVFVDNRGTIPSAPVLLVRGDMPNGYAIYGPGDRVYQITSGINSGNRDVIDMAHGLLIRDGISVTGVYGQRNDTWHIPPGGANQVLVPNGGAGQMDVTVHPAFF